MGMLHVLCLYAKPFIFYIHTTNFESYSLQLILNRNCKVMPLLPISVPSCSPGLRLLPGGGSSTSQRLPWPRPSGLCFSVRAQGPADADRRDQR